MSFVPNFTLNNISGEPSIILVTDTSTGSDAAIRAYRLYLLKSDGTYLVPSGTVTDYIQWLVGSLTHQIDCLSKDFALIPTLKWINVNGSVLYSKTLDVQGFTLWNETFDYYTTQMLTANGALINDNNFWNNKSTVRTYIDAGDKAILNAADQDAAQLCYDEATKLRVGSQYYFNSNS